MGPHGEFPDILGVVVFGLLMVAGGWLGRVFTGPRKPDQSISDYEKQQNMTGIFTGLGLGLAIVVVMIWRFAD